MKYNLLFLFVFSLTRLFIAQENGSNYKKDQIGNSLSRELTSEEMLSDLALLKTSIQKVHPDPFDRCTEGNFNLAFNAATEAVQLPLSLLEFSRILSVLLNTLEDSHTALNPRDLLLLLSKKRPFAPFYLTRIDDKFYLSKIFKDRIPLGVEVLNVNNYSMYDLYMITQHYAPSEGSEISARNELVSIMMGLVFNVCNKSPEDPVLMTYISLKGDTIQKPLASMRSCRYLNKNNKWYEKRNLEFEFKDSSAYIGLKSFDAKRERRYMRGIDSFFKKVEKFNINNLTIDIRGNRGGYVLLLEHVLSYINTNGATFDLNYLYKRSTLDRFETLSRLEKVDFEKKAQRVYPKGMISKEFDFYKSEMGTIESILYEKRLTNRKARTFRGNCKLLTNGLSMSASVLMASWFKTHDRGEIIGTPCFGSMDGTHGNPGQVILTNSGLPISISTLKLNTFKGAKGFEVSPDIPVKLSIQDFIEKRDPFKSYY